MAIRTDLHTHLAGVLSASELLDLGLAHGVSLDAGTAGCLRIVKPGYEGLPIPLSDLTKKEMAKLKAGLELTPEKKGLFRDLDKIYANREFITKDPDLFVPLLEKIAEVYQKQGVFYTELSSTSLMGNPWMIRAIHENVPRIEARTGVKLRFLGALDRHADPEWNLDQADRLKTILQSPYVVGIDVVGHEKNPVRDLKEPLQSVISFAARNIPGCVVRVHAGENPYYSADPSTLDDTNFNNAYEAVQIADEARRDSRGELLGPYGHDMQIRIGHGRYGLQPETLNLIAETGTIPELCLSSNMLLNHADSFKGPFNLYAGHGIPFVLGSDGCGLYGTTMPEEFVLAVDAGLTAAVQKTIGETEELVIARDRARFQEKMQSWSRYKRGCAAKGIDPFEALGDVAYDTPDGKPRWNPGITAAREEAVVAKYDALVSSLDEMGINTDAELIDRLLKEHEALVFKGSSKTSWENVPEDQQEKIIETMKVLIDRLDGHKDIVVTEGTDYGFSSVIHRLIEERNEELAEGNRIPVIGAFTLEANTVEIREGTLSHAVVLQRDGELAKTWMDQSPALLDMVFHANAKIIVAGGGQVIRDMIVYADRRGLIDDGKVFLFDGITGASGEKAADYPHAKFYTADDLVKLMAGDKGKKAKKPRRPKPPGS